MRADLLDRSLRHLRRRAVTRDRATEHEVAVDERAVDQKRAGERIAREPEYFLDLGRAHMSLATEEVVEVMPVRLESELCRLPSGQDRPAEGE